MREPSSDQGERGEQRCCISSDAEGRILTTSFPPFSHPLSVRPIPEAFYHLERFDSENTGTAIAQIGRAISPVPSSQKVDNIRWHKWLGQPSSPLSSRAAVEGSRASLEHRLSPGISEVRRPKQEPPPSSPPSSGFTTENLVDSVKSREEEMVPLSSPHDHEESSVSARVGSQEQGSAATNIAEVLDLKHIPGDFSSSQPPLAEQVCAESDGTDPDEAWKTFVFGYEKSDEVSKAAFEEAKHDAIRSLQPSEFLVPSDEGSGSDGHSHIATVGTIYTKHDDETFEYAEPCFHAEVSGSLEATCGPSSTRVESGVAMDLSDEFAQDPSLRVNAGTSSISDLERAPDSPDNSGFVSAEEADSSTSALHAGAPSMTTSMAVAPARSDAVSSETGTTAEQFRFSQPKLFVGSRSNPSQPVRPAGPGVGISLTKRRRGRSKKRTNDGRADIRALPNYSGDPIEEFEEERVPKEGRLPKSLFPALELA
ncbi:hypothetical protein C8A01DRAFT_13686 [Parachaetomium inaequale]|uniref:Uncharacterized protein n=1 Tax=Parachaetomium inaequale TaxID=2588326 RepID=A0AAN6SUH1_9PEZI|nr:hypothetical protein C8A01DRAFT_13686 [Parachaetomium inaequale]